MKRIKQYFTKRKEKERMQEESRLRSEFRVTERGGSLWITHDDVAIGKVPEDFNADDIAKELTRCRDAAVEYKRL